MNMKIILALLLLSICLTSLKGSVFVTFSGGNGTQLSVTFSNPINFELTATPQTGNLLGILIQDVGASDFDNDLSAHTGTLTLEGQTSSTDGQMGGGALAGQINADDIVIGFNSSFSVTSGQTITASAGTRTTNNNISLGAAPANGNYNVVIVDPFDSSIISNAGTAVPEGEHTVLILSGAALILLIFGQKHFFSKRAP